ncbi:MAG: hypothetical protein RIQ94_2470 [Pseudomonadota bacterium]
MVEIGNTMNLQPCLIRLAQLQHDSVDRLALLEATEAALAKQGQSPRKQLQVVAEHLQLPAPRWLSFPDVAVMPILMYANAQGQWISEWWDVLDNRWQEQADSELQGYSYALFKLSKPFVATRSPVYQLIKQETFSHRKLIIEAIIGGVMINLIAMTTSLYSMQIYDRVVPVSFNARGACRYIIRTHGQACSFQYL